ncbi:N-succinyl-L,L-diaminopimelate desuccinylase [hydrothermal vent metagenome]|uniref:Succinyl-diaminopimelate desuccinylase n=1 Tax=hydrothermal vent metagenome TaxID=652676 RepID=A0A3B0YZN6_9ZZZZ
MTNRLSPTLLLAQDLVSRKSVTPHDAGCQDVLIERLEKLGFNIERLLFGDVKNIWARLGNTDPVLAFAGHTDVVPTGPVAEWTHPPFSAEVIDGMLQGRGTADMKGSIAAMTTAVERFLTQYPNPKGSIAFLITSDEEGPSIDGTVKVVEWLEQRNEKIKWCLVGEPSSKTKTADVIKNGRRGSLNGELIVHGKQGHVAYPHLADNPFHSAVKALAELCEYEWDQGNQHFPATTFQISNLHTGAGATNVIPGKLKLLFNFRFSTESTEEGLKDQVHKILDSYSLNYDLDWKLSGHPFITPEGELVQAIVESVEQHLGYQPELSTSGGTSDGRFIAPTGAQVVELGPLNATIHQIDECVSVQSLDDLSAIYESTLVKLFT